MISAQLSNFTKGWFVGDFAPTLCRPQVVEVAVKKFRAGETEAAHFHKIATEYTVVISGRVRMFEREWKEGDVVVAEPGDKTSFTALTDAVLTVVKFPGAPHDKYLVSDS